MGLSASQARLLSITARLTDNEYHSQQIANAKMRLAAKGTEARQEYQDALNSSVLVYNGFDKQGNSTTTVFTPNVIYQYQPLKNQYALINNSGQILVNNTDAKNFEETDTLGEFLDRYNVLKKTGHDVMKVRPDETQVENPEYAQAMKDREDDYNNRLKEWEDNEKAIEDFPNRPVPKPEDYVKQITTFTIGGSETATDLYEMFANASRTCFDNAMGGSKDCYKHVLAHMIDLEIDLEAGATEVSNGYPKTVVTTVGKRVDINSGDVNHSFINSVGMTPHMFPVSEVIKNGYDPGDGSNTTLMAYKHDDPGNDGAEWEKLISAHYIKTGNATEVQKLLSNYKLNASGQVVQKTLHEKCIDLLYAIKNSIADYDSIMLPIIQTFQEDMNISLKGLSVTENTETIPDKDAYNQAIDDYNNETPPEPYDKPEIGPLPEVPELITKTIYVRYKDTEYDYEVIDKEKAQWYTNLWFRMNGYKEPERIQTKEGYEDNMDYYREYLLKTLKAQKDTFAKGYEVLDVHLASSTTWLEDVLSQGIVVMQRVNSHTIETQKKFSWDNIIYTDASELTIETDDNAIAKAEVVYEEKMREIETKDKRYQMEINKLDSEHNSLQTQIDSIKSEVSKNIERSYKTFG